MGPPLARPAVREENANDDQMDILANAGIDLRAEEAFAASFHTNSIGQQPQGADSFYGSGPANQPGSSTEGKTQEEIKKELADSAWKAASAKLAHSRQHELSHPHTHVGALWSKMDKIARENGLTLNTDQGKMPKLKLPDSFERDIVLVEKVGPEGTMIVAEGTFLPPDTALADQLALMSLATSTRIRMLLEEAYAISKARRLHSHGAVPTEFTDVAVAQPLVAGSVVQENEPRQGWESAVSPGTRPNGTSTPSISNS